MSIRLNSPFKSNFNTGRFAPVGKYGDFPALSLLVLSTAAKPVQTTERLRDSALRVC